MNSQFTHWLRTSKSRIAMILALLAVALFLAVDSANSWGWRRAPQPIPTISIESVVPDETVTINTRNFPAGQDFVVTMGPYGSRGINGIVVGTTNSGEGGSFKATYPIPDELKGSYRIAIRLQTQHARPYFAFNWFYNNTSGTGGPNGDAGYMGIPTIHIVSVVRDQSVTFETKNYPADKEFTVTMGPFGTRGIRGIEVGTFNSGDGSSSQQTFNIPAELQGMYRIAIRAQTSDRHPFFSYNWFYNNTADVGSTISEAAGEATADEEVGTGGGVETEDVAETPVVEEAPSLTGTVWQWTSFVSPVTTTEVDNPAQYTILFNEDGTLNIKADCNTVLGSYTSEGSSISIELGPSTLAACPPESLSDQYLASLAAAAIYFFEEDDLLMDLFADGGTMRFNAAPAAEADSGEAAAGTDEEAVETSGELTGTTWQWSSLTDPNGIIEVPNPEQYTILFNEDGTLSIKADCNNVLGSYTTEDSSLSIVLGPSTLAACPPESLSDQYLANLASAAIYFFEKGDLLIDLMADAGTMRFTAAPAEEADSGEAAAGDDASAAVPQDAPGQDLLGTTWQWVAFVGPSGSVEVNAPENYTVEFFDDSTFSALADCNMVNGNYITDGNSIGITLGASTNAACPPESLSDQFVASLDAAAVFTFEGSDLLIDLVADGGTMRLVPATETAAAPDEAAAPAAEATAEEPAAAAAPAEAAAATVQASMGMGMGGMYPGVPSFKICDVVRDQSVTFETNNFPANQDFVIEMKPMWSRGPVIEAGTFNSGDGASFSQTVSIPAELAGYYRIQIRARTSPMWGGYMAYNWFYNNTASVCGD